VDRRVADIEDLAMEFPHLHIVPDKPPLFPRGSSHQCNILGTFFLQVSEKDGQRKEAEMMNQGHHQFAEALVFVHGSRAGIEAARHAILCEKSGDAETADIWRHVLQAVQSLGRKKAA
jgi:hypothetical protein